MENNNDNLVGVVGEKKKTNKMLVLVLVLIIVGLLGYIGYDKLYANKEVNKDNEVKSTNSDVKSNSETVNKELDDQTKDELLKIIGLTEDGYKKLSTQEVKEHELDASSEWIDFSAYNIINYFLGLSDGVYTVNDLDEEAKLKIIEYAPIAKDKLIGLNTKDENDNICQNGADSCLGITPDTYSYVAKKYGFSLDAATVFTNGTATNLYDGKYYILIPYTGVMFNPSKIKDSVKFSDSNDSYYVVYDINLSFVSHNTPSNKDINQTIKFKFDKDKNLVSFEVVNK